MCFRNLLLHVFPKLRLKLYYYLFIQYTNWTNCGFSLQQNFNIRIPLETRLRMPFRYAAQSSQRLRLERLHQRSTPPRSFEQFHQHMKMVRNPICLSIVKSLFHSYSVDREIIWLLLFHLLYIYTVVREIYYTISIMKIKVVEQLGMQLKNYLHRSGP